MTVSIESNRKLALTIGINNYPHENQLENCINDAKDVKEALESIQFHVTIGIDCKKDEFERLVNKLAEEVQMQDLVFFYFAGHGSQFDDKNYLYPAGYSYDYSISERKYIEQNSINAQYILHQIERKRPRATIVILDCCRTFVKTRSDNNQQAFAGMKGPPESLIVFSCGLGHGAIDDTLNDRNGIFTEQLLKHLTKPNLDIETILQMTGKDVKSNGYPLPWRSSCLTDKIYLVTNNIEDENTNRTHSISSIPRNINSNHTLPAVRPSSRHSFIEQKTSQSAVSLEPIRMIKSSKISDSTHRQQSPSITDSNRNLRRSASNKLTTPSSPRLLNKNCSQYSPISQEVYRSEPSNVQKQTHFTRRLSRTKIDDDSSDRDSSSDDIVTPKIDTKRYDMESNSTRIQSSQCNTLTKVVSVVQQKSTSFPSPPITQIIVDNTISSSYVDKKEPPIIHIRSLCGTHQVKITENTTMQDLIHIIWCEVNFDMERYTRNAYILLLFNHRLHIFVEDTSNTLVTDFLLLSPSSNQSEKDPIDFYVYGLPREHAASMYNIDHDYASLFGNPNSWHPVYYSEYKQLERPQSIFLSSLYALRLYFRTDIQELKAERLTMEAQFFLQLRNYLFPPAILAFKHSIVGSMFSFEKPLLMDALIELLTRLCDPEKIFLNEICDFIPLLFCWLLEACDRNDEKGDSFLEVKLINSEKKQKFYFQNPVTISEQKRRILELQEFNGAHDTTVVVHHVDIRSLTLHLTRVTNNTSKFAYNEYVIYDPISYDRSVSPSLQYWTEAEIADLYKMMARTRDYRSFIIITRGAVTADVKNQLVLLHEGRTVALLFSYQKAIRPGGKTRKDVDNFVQIFNPFRCTKEKSSILVTPDTILDERELPDPRMPLHFTNILLNTQPSDDPFLDNDTTSPAHQVTLILLDRSRSMSDYRIASPDTSYSFTHIDMCKIMLSRLSDNILSTNQIHAFGLIQFATKYKTVCSITRSREQFEKAINFDDCSGDWTCMYDAVHEAIRQIKTFTHSPMRARRDCKKLIICLSDGIDNSGSTTIETLRNEIKRNRIVIDFISFIRDDQLKKQKEIDKARQFRELCTYSGGYVYQHLCIQSDLELAAMFEQEAAVWISKRSRTKFGAVDKPERYISATFQKTAIRNPPVNKNLQQSSNLHRILRECQEILNSSSENVFVFVVPENIAYWKVILKGPSRTPYERKFWMLHVEFDSNYPKCAPNVRFFTPIFHVNINGDGKICHQILGRSWCQQTKMKTVFENILDLLQNPNFEDAISLEKGHLYKENPIEYRKQVVIHSNKYAYNDLEKMKCDYKLEDYGEQFEQDLD